MAPADAQPGTDASVAHQLPGDQVGGADDLDVAGPGVGRVAEVAVPGGQHEGIGEVVGEAGAGGVGQRAAAGRRRRPQGGGRGAVVARPVGVDGGGHAVEAGHGVGRVGGHEVLGGGGLGPGRVDRRDLELRLGRQRLQPRPVGDRGGDLRAGGVDGGDHRGLLVLGGRQVRHVESRSARVDARRDRVSPRRAWADHQPAPASRTTAAAAPAATRRPGTVLRPGASAPIRIVTARPPHRRTSPRSRTRWRPPRRCPGRPPG